MGVHSFCEIFLGNSLFLWDILWNDVILWDILWNALILWDSFGMLSLCEIFLECCHSVRYFWNALFLWDISGMHSFAIIFLASTHAVGYFWKTLSLWGIYFLLLGNYWSAFVRYYFEGFLSVRTFLVAAYLGISFQYCKTLEYLYKMCIYKIIMWPIDSSHE